MKMFLQNSILPHAEVMALGLIHTHHGERRLDQAVAEPEGRGRELVVHVGRTGVVVATIEDLIRSQLQLKLFHDVITQYPWQKFAAEQKRLV